MSFDHDLQTTLRAAADEAPLPESRLESVMRRGRRRRIAAAVGSTAGVIVVLVAVVGGTAWLTRSTTTEPPVADSSVPTIVDQTTTTVTDAPATTAGPTTTVPPQTTVPMPTGPVDRTYVAWQDTEPVTHVVYDASGILAMADTGAFGLLANSFGAATGQPSIRHDLEGGFVYLDGSFLMWWPQGEDEPRVVAESESFSSVALWEVVASGGRRAAAIGGYGSDEVMLYELETGEAATGTTADLRYGFDDFTYPIISPDGTRRAHIDNTDRSSDLVIELVEDGAELFRQTISSPERFVRLHDFDGNRVIVSRESFEPAAAPQVFFLYDFACGDTCTRRFYSQGGEAALIGEDPSVEGKFEEQYLTAACSATGLDALTTPQEGLPEAVAATRSAISEATVGCAMDRLWQLSGVSGEFRLVTSHLAVPTSNPWHGREAFIGPITRGLRLTLDLPYRQNTDGSFTWPSFADATSFEQLTSDEQTALVEYYRAFGSDRPEEKARTGFLEIEAYPEWSVTISADGTWLSFTRSIS